MFVRSSSQMVVIDSSLIPSISCKMCAMNMQGHGKEKSVTTEFWEIILLMRNSRQLFIKAFFPFSS